MTTLTIRGALTNLIVIQKGLTITDPATLSVKKAWRYFPPAKLVIRAALPAWMNEYTMNPVERGANLRIMSFTIHSQLVVADLDNDYAADVASAFLDKYLTALDADSTLGGTVTSHTIRGGSPTLATITRSEDSYIGLDLLMDIEQKEAATFA